MAESKTPKKKSFNLKFKEIPNTENFKKTNFLKNPRINKIMADYTTLYSTNLKRKYNQISNEIILENIKSIEENQPKQLNKAHKILYFLILLNRCQQLTLEENMSDPY